ncbi:hypothetical protein MPTK1_3g17620 [Marchantia polymorpha subsp. ruderalis]|uniref:DUF4228 domain-containing protein n=2 Tax=Marchantia polymorpha TaxID=3197 RepID=A0AAF6B1W7_MARPO|nr:hypothetical protein MARPO_0039s0033 [Marchantia polymorpha]BBN06001.1 hypothetical protein Mp_3g17620 [Marchantia polymorpha subsp. ruderalis]|eukprot:PTQ40524.1 hypothetical protein MARPO_0039s0033 [Marchantia polymorpha]
MGNAATCSLVDVVGTVTVTQTDGQMLEFVQPVFAFQVRKLHPGNWLVHYMSVHDPTLGQHSKMSMLAGNEELQPGEIYFLLPIPSHFRKQLFGSKRHSSKGNPNGTSTSTGTGNNSHHHHQSSSKDTQISQRLQLQLQPLYDIIEGTTPKPQEITMSALSTTLATPLLQQQTQHYLSSSLMSIPQQRPTKRCSRQRFHVARDCDWRPTLVTIPEVF